MSIVIISVIGLIISLIGLIISSQYIIKTVEEYMEKTKRSQTITGFVILAVISSLAELVVAIFSIIEGVPEVSVGDIFGSHLFNICVVVGILALLGYFKCCQEKTLVEMVDILILAAIIPVLLLITEFRQILTNIAIFIGIALISIYFISIYFIGKTKKPIISELNNNILVNDKKEKTITKKISKRLIIIKLTIGGTIIVISGRFTIYSALLIIEYYEIIPITFGAKIIAVGTSLPELAICYTAAKKGKVKLALADVLGANLITSTLILGIILIFSPFNIDLIIFTELILFIIIANIILLRFLLKGEIPPYIGIILILIYIIFQAIVSF